MKYSKDITQKICDHLRAGNGRIQAAKKAGIASSTFFEWYNKYPEFSSAIKSAQEIGETYVKETCISVIMRAAVENEQWQAAAWILERRYPREYGRRVEVEDKTPPPPPALVIEVTNYRTAEKMKQWYEESGKQVEIRDGGIKEPLNPLYNATDDQVDAFMAGTGANFPNREISTPEPEPQPEQKNVHWTDLKSADSADLKPAPAQEPQPARPQQFGTYVLQSNYRKTHI